VYMYQYIEYNVLMQPYAVIVSLALWRGNYTVFPSTPTPPFLSSLGPNRILKTKIMVRLLSQTHETLPSHSHFNKGSQDRNKKGPSNGTQLSLPLNV
jgi:hypothetical protein